MTAVSSAGRKHALPYILNLVRMIPQLYDLFLGFSDKHARISGYVPIFSLKVIVHLFITGPSTINNIDIARQAV
jgi:hypothetical protein